MADQISPEDAFEIAQPPSLAQVAYEKIRESILMGKLKPGEPLNDIGIATSMGISRTPVRQALHRLASEGLLDSTHRKGIQVKSFSLEDFDEVYEIRLLLVPAVVEKISLMKDAIDYRDMEHSLELSRLAIANNDIQMFIDSDCKFHESIGLLSGNQRLSWIMGNLKDMIQIVSWESLDHEGRMEEVLRQHEIILTHMKNGEHVLARKAAENHLRASRQTLVDHHYSHVEECT